MASLQSFPVRPLSSKLGRGRREEDFFVIPTVCHGHPVQILLLTSSLKQAWTRPFVKVFCGERGIRTPETLLEFTRFPGVPLQPLEHLSFVGMRLSHERRLPASLGRPRFLLLTRTHEVLVSFSFDYRNALVA